MRELAVCYRAGADASVTICAHAICERTLAARIEHSSTPPAGYLRWGLGQIIQELSDRHGLPPNLEQRLRDLNDWRKSLYHWGHSTAPTALEARVKERLNDPAQVERIRSLIDDGEAIPRNRDVYALAFDLELRDTALEALKSTLLVRDWNEWAPLP